MTKRLIFGFILLCLATSCNQNKPQTSANELSTFASPYDTLAGISLPISITPESWNDLYSKHIDDYGLPANTDIFLRPYAKLHSNKFYKAIIFISNDETGAPLLISLDKNNNKVSELNLLGDWNSNDPSKYTNETVIIGKDLTISLIDSIKTYDTTIDGDRIESSEKLTIKNESFSISEKGTFIRSSNH